MMKVVSWVVKAALFFLAFTFAVKNTDPVAVRYYLGMEWQTSLIFVMLLAFCLGAVAGVVASLGYVLRLRRQVGRLQKQLTGELSDGTAVRTPSTGAALIRFPDAV